MEDHNKTGGKVHGLVVLKKHTGDNTVHGMEETVKEGTVIRKKLPEPAVNGENTMPVWAVNELKGHRGSALHGAQIPTGRAETAVASEGDEF